MTVLFWVGTVMGAVLLVVGVLRIASPRGPHDRPDCRLLAAGAATFLGFLALTVPTHGPSMTHPLGWITVTLAGVEVGVRVHRSLHWLRWEHELRSPTSANSPPHPKRGIRDDRTDRDLP